MVPSKGKYMSKKLTANTIGVLDALARDIAGNILSGNNERALVYLRGQLETLAALRVNMEKQNDVRADLTLEATIKDINTRLYDQLDNRYPLSMSDASVTMKNFKDAGIDMSEFLKPVSEVMSGLSPEIEEYIKSKMSTTTI